MHPIRLVALLALASCAPSSGPRQARLTLNLADTAMAGGAPRLALQVTQGILAQHPRDVPALLHEGDALYVLGQPGAAAEAYGKALAIDPASAEAELGLGRIALMRDPASARAHFTRVLALQPGNVPARSDRGIASDLMGRHDEAQSDYRVAVGLAPDNVAAQANLGLSLALGGDPADGVRLLRPLAAAPAASHRVRQDLAVALVLAGQDEEAERILLEQMSPTQVKAALLAYRALGNQPLPSSLAGGAS